MCLILHRPNRRNRKRRPLSANAYQPLIRLKYSHDPTAVERGDTTHRRLPRDGRLTPGRAASAPVRGWQVHGSRADLPYPCPARPGCPCPARAGCPGCLGCPCLECWCLGCGRVSARQAAGAAAVTVAGAWIRPPRRPPAPVRPATGRTPVPPTAPATWDFCSYTINDPTQSTVTPAPATHHRTEQPHRARNREAERVGGRAVRLLDKRPTHRKIQRCPTRCRT